jgi:hypothetical protein
MDDLIFYALPTLNTNSNLILPIISLTQYLVIPEGSNAVIALGVCKLVPVLLSTNRSGVIDQWLDYSCGNL